jgi:hypothetical protein
MEDFLQAAAAGFVMGFIVVLIARMIAERWIGDW